MDQPTTPASSMESSGDTSRLLKELMDLQKTTASSIASIDRSMNLQESQDNATATMTGVAHGTGDATDPTLTELMKTMYDGSAARQLITLQGSDTANSFSVYGQEVDIVSSKQNSQSLTGSNKIKVTPVVNFEWETRRYIGNIVAVHRNNNYAAYVIKGKSGGVVRVINRTTAERSLLKDFIGRVIDLAFAHTDDVHLAVVDEIGNLYIYNITTGDDRKIVCPLLLHVIRPQGTLVSEYHRVIWCPYIPDDIDDSSATESSTTDASRMLVLTNDEKAEIWSVDLVLKDHASGPVSPEDVEVGLLQIDSHTKPIMDAAFSPDGTALATASLDGEVKFFQVYMHEGSSPRCLHQWKPHGGQPMSCLFFLDDHKNFTSDAQFWKFAVTGANSNQEIKIWSCESWNCLQTVRFLCPPGLPSNFSVDPCMKAALDLSARYLILSDIRRKVLYVLQIHQNSDNNTAHVSSVSEFILAQPCLSFAILDAGTKKFVKTTGDDSHLDEITTGEIDQEEDRDEGGQRTSDDNLSRLGIQIKLYTVHPKALQELLIRFKPESSAPPPTAPSLSSVSQSETGVVDALSDISMSVDANGVDTEHRNDASFSGQDSGHPVLLTPDAFTSSPRKSYPEDSILDPVRGSASSTSSFTHVTAMNDDFLSPRSSSGGSTITQTPTTPKTESMSPIRANQDVTPSSVPLPPATAMEESELATPTSSTGRESLHGEGTPTKLTPRDVDSFFAPSNSRTELQQVSLDSTESTGLFEVSEIHSQKPQASYDEDDEEVAEVMGESVTDSYSDGQPEGTQPFVEQTEPEEEGDVIDTQEEGQQSIDNMLRAWPKPPDVSTESQRLVTEDNEESTQEDEDVKIIEETEEDLGEEEEDGEEGDEDQKAEDEEIMEEIEDVEEEGPEESDESVDSGKPSEPKVAPVARSGYTASPRESQAVEVREIHREIVREVMDHKELSRLHSNIEQILGALTAQQQQLDQLRREMSDQQEQYIEIQRRHLEQEQLRQQVPQDSQPSIEEHLGKLENIVSSRVERLFTQHAQKENQRIQELMRHSESQNEQRQDRLYNTVTQTLNSAVASNIEKTVRTEFRNTVVPNVTRVLEPVKEQMHQEMAQKLTATDSLLKDNIGKMIRSRQTVEAIGMAAGSAIQAPIQAAYRESFQNIVIPTFERATQNMYQQVSEVMNKGTKEYSKQLESHLEHLRQKHLEVRDPMVSELRKLTDSFQTAAEQMKAHTLAAIQNQLTTQVQAAMSSLQENTLRFVREAVREEVSVAVKEQGVSISDSVLNAFRSGAVTPIQVTPDPQVERTHVMNLLRQGQLNAAFQQALSASNLELVMMVCETVNPSQVFNQSPCPLQQPVLLSLIQQLSADLGNNTELKHKYLEEAVMNLDTHDPVTQEHIKGVLYGLIQKLKLYVQAHPNDKTTRSLRMLQMASESLLK